MQRLMGRLVALGPFIAWFTNKFHSFFTTLCRTQKFGWTEDCKSAFDAMKHCLIEPPILSSLKEKNELYMYLVVLDYATSVVYFDKPMRMDKSSSTTWLRHWWTLKPVTLKWSRQRYHCVLLLKNSIHISRHIKWQSWQINHWGSPCKSPIYLDGWWSRLLSWASMAYNTSLACHWKAMSSKLYSRATLKTGVDWHHQQLVDLACKWSIMNIRGWSRARTILP